VALSFLYWAFRRLLELLALRLRSEQSKEIEILVLRHQLHVLRRGEIARPRLERSAVSCRAASGAHSSSGRGHSWAGTNSSFAGAGPTDAAPARAVRRSRASCAS
jgi:hypothetical protein